jgi:hypothetical protein
MGLGLLAACSRAPEPAPPLPQEAYVWQRQWTPAVSAAVRERSADFSGLRVLALQQLERGPLELRPDLEALRECGLPLRAVLRMEGTRPRAEPEALAAQISAIVERWRAAGLRVEGVEVDHDCGTAGLDEYAIWLRRFRERLDASGRLSITALPSWLTAPAALAELRDVADESVLQVHALDARRQRLIDVDEALHWAQAWQAQAARPFRLALPAYSLRLRMDRGGRVRAVDAETAIDTAGEGAVERHADPVDLARLVNAVSQQRLPQLRGLLWFRLPVDGDRRSWSAATLRAAMRGEAPGVRIELLARPLGGDRFDLLLHNIGDHDGLVPSRIALGADCRLIEGLPPWQPDRAMHALLASERPWLQAGQQRALGFARCATPLPHRQLLPSD